MMHSNRFTQQTTKAIEKLTSLIDDISRLESRIHRLENEIKQNKLNYNSDKTKEINTLAGRKHNLFSELELLIRNPENDQDILLHFIRYNIPTHAEINPNICIQTLFLFEKYNFFETDDTNATAILFNEIILVLSKHNLLTAYLAGSSVISPSSTSDNTTTTSTETIERKHINTDEQQIANLVDHLAMFKEEKRFQPEFLIGESENLSHEGAASASYESAAEGNVSESKKSEKASQLTIQLISTLDYCARQKKYRDPHLPTNWVKLLNYFLLKFSAPLENHVELIKTLINNPIFPAEEALVELMSHYQLFDASESKKINFLIKTLGHAAGHKEAHINFLKLFSRLYELNLDTAHQNIRNFVLFLNQVIVDLAIQFKCDPAKLAEQALLAIERVLADTIRGLDFSNHEENRKRNQQIVNSALNITQHIINNFQINPCKVFNSRSQSFFDLIFNQWKQHAERTLPHQINGLKPHHIFVNGEYKLYYQITRYNHLTKIEDKLACYILLSEFIPLLHNEKLFVKHIQQLFADDIKLKEIILLRKTLIQTNGLPDMNEPTLDALKTAIIHRLNGESQQDATFIVTLLKIANKQRALIFKVTFNHQKSWLTPDNAIEPETKEGADYNGGLAILETENDIEPFNLLINADAIIKIPALSIQLAESENKIISSPARRDAKASKTELKSTAAAPIKSLADPISVFDMHLLFNNFIQVLSNSIDFSNQEKIQILQKLPEMFCRIDINFAITFLRNLLSDGNIQKELKHNVDDEARHTKHLQKANQIFKALACQEQLSKDYQKKFKNIKEEIIKLPEMEKYNNLFYYRLFKNNINPNFCKSFLNTRSEKLIMKHFDDENFKNLYQSYESKPSEDHLIRLIGIQRYTDALITSEVFDIFNQLQNDLGSNAIANELVSNALRKLITLFDAEQTNYSLFKETLLQINNIIRRTITDQDKENYAKKIYDIIQLKDQISDKLTQVIMAMTQTHPLIEDVSDAIDTILREEKAENLYKFIQTLNQRQLTSKLSDDEKSKVILEKILLRIEKYSPTDRYASTIINILTCSSHPLSRVNFYSTTSIEQYSWFQFLWMQKPPLFSVINQMITEKVQSQTPFKEEKRSEHSAYSRYFIDVFFDEIIKQPLLLQDDRHFKIFISILCENTYYAPKAIGYLISSIPEQKTTSSHLELKSDDQHIFAKMIEKINDPYFNILVNIGCALLKAKRFDLFKYVSASYHSKTGRRIHHDYYNVDQELQKSVASNYHAFIDTPGFYTPYNQVIRLTSNLDDRVNIALNTLNTEAYDQHKVLEFFRILDKLKYEKPQIYDRYFCQIIKQRIFNKVSLYDLSIILASIHALNIPELFPIDHSLTEIFAHPINEWIHHIAKLHENIKAFKIAGLNPVEVKKQFKEQKSSFNHIINTLKCNDPIEYFFKIYGNVIDFMNHFPKSNNFASLNKDERIKTLLPLYHENKPFQYNETDDTKFFGALCLVSQETLGKTPFHAQFATFVGVMYVTVDKFFNNLDKCLDEKDKVKILADVATGQGKTIIMAFNAVCLVKMSSHKLSILPITTLTDNLAIDNAAENKPFFDVFNIPSGCDVTERKHIVRYCTSHSLRRKIVLDKISLIATDEEKLIALLSDETDVDLAARRNEFRPVFCLEFKEFTPFLKEFYKIVKQNSHISSKEYIIILAKSTYAYINLPQDMKDHFNHFASNFFDTALKIINNPAIGNKDGSTKLTERETGLEFNYFGYYGEPQFIQMKQEAKSISEYQLTGFAIYDSDILNLFKIFIGYSGTLGSAFEESEYKKLGFQIVKTARFNGKNLISMDPVLCENTDTWKNEIVRVARASIAKGVPVLIFVSTEERVKEVQNILAAEEKKSDSSSGIKKINTIVGTEYGETYTRIVKEATQVGTVTISTVIGGRGVDYKLHNREINDKGGLVVIDGDVSLTQNIAWQKHGRTARNDNNGIVFQIFDKSELITLLKENDINVEDLNTSNMLRKIFEMRAEFIKRKFKKAEIDKSINMCTQISNHFYSEVFGGSKEQRSALLRRFCLFFQKVPQITEDTSKRVEAINEYNAHFGTKFTGGA